MTVSGNLSTGEESANLERRREARVPTIEPCGYQLARFTHHASVEFTDGYGLSLNASPQGLLLLMHHAPETQQVFEIHVPVPSKEGTVVKLVESCWTREVTFGTAGKAYLVGVKALFESR